MARSRRRRTTTERAAGLIALALPAPVQRVADTRIGSLLMLVGVPAMLIFGCLNIKIVDGFPTLSLNGQRAAELQRVASQQLNEFEHQVAQQNWGAVPDLLRSTQSTNSPYFPNGSAQTQQPNTTSLAQQQQYLWQQQQLQQRQAYQQAMYQQQNQFPYGQPNNQQQQQQQQYQPQSYSNQPYPQQTYQQQTYQQPGLNQPAYPQQTYQQPNYPQQTYQQPGYQQPNGLGTTAYQPANAQGYGAYGQTPSQPNGYPVPVQKNSSLLPSTSNSSQRSYSQPGSLLR